MATRQREQVYFYIFILCGWWYC